MKDKIKVLLLGDNQDSWHPLETAKKEIAKIVTSNVELHVTEDYTTLSSLARSEYDVFISYTDSWNRIWSSEQTEGLVDFVASGGGFIAIHNGISLQSSNKLYPIIGARFITHPSAQTLDYYGVIKDHPLLTGVNNFSVVEEPYQVEFDPSASKNVFLEFAYNGRRYPAAWEKNYGLGKVVYLQPGHSHVSFKPKAFRKLVLNSINWVYDSIDTPHG